MRSALLITGLLLVLLIPHPGTTSTTTFAADDPGDGGKADDAVRRILLAGDAPAKDIFEIRQRLEAHGGTLKAHLVVNGGHDNPARTDRHRTKFMCFATYSNATAGKMIEEDELFFGFFLGVANGDVVVLPGFVELIAWDRTKQVYNFWELIGTKWHYRGDSNDILANIASLNVGAAKPAFTFTRKSPTDGTPVLRCSGCHTSGGPIMKELHAPHNDWWTKDRKLNLGPFKLRPGDKANDAGHVAARLFDPAKEATDAGNLAEQVKKGTARLLAARAKQDGAGQNLRQQLRSLFTTMEINLVSDSVPFADRLRTGSTVEIPQDFFVDARLAGKGKPVAVKVKSYDDALTAAESVFASGETPKLRESHHAFLVPARSNIDDQVIESLLKAGVVDEEFVVDVLAVDFTTPVFSQARASLVRHIPEKAKDAADLRRQVIASLEAAVKLNPNDTAASEFLGNLTDPNRSAAAHREAATAYLDACRKAAESGDVAADWLKVAAQRRREITAAETAKHPDGPITEPGFRVIFPTVKETPKPGEWRLDPATGKAIRKEN